MNEIKPYDHILYQANCGLGLLNAKSIRISQNNVISILNSNGVCFMKNDNNWVEFSTSNFLNFIKISIDNPKATFKHNLHRIVRTYVSKFSTEEFSKTNLDHTLFPWSQVGNPSLYKCYRSLEWSFGDCLDNEPLFALLSVEHELWIYKLNSNFTYNQVINVSKILLENYTKTHKSKHDITYQSLKDIIYSTAIMKMCWTEFHIETIDCSNDINESSESINNSNKKEKRNQRGNDNEMEVDLRVTIKTTELINHICLLITLSKNGIIYFFKIKQNSDEITCTYLNEWQPDNHVIKDIYYHQNILVIVFTNGTIELIRFEFNEKNIVETDFEFASLIKQRIVLWDEEDDIEVDDLLIYERDSLIFIVFTKTTFLIARILESASSNQTLKRKPNSSNPINQFSKSSASTNSINQTVINHQNLKIRERIVEDGIFRMSSSGICRLYDEKLLLASIDGSYVQIKFSDDFKQLKQTKLNLENINGNLEVKSLCSSKDGYLCCSISHLSIYFDHLEVRDSTQLTIFTTISKREILDKIIDLIDTKDETIQFKDLYNLLRCFNICLINGETKGKAGFIEYVEENLNDFIDLNLKVLRFALICEHSNIKREVPSTDLFEFMKDLDENDGEDENNNQVYENSTNKNKRKRTASLRNETTNDNKLTADSGDSVASNKLIKSNHIKNKQKAEDYEEFIKRIEIVLSKRHFNRLIKQHSSRKNLTEQQHESFDLMSNYLNKKKKATAEVCPICKQRLILDDSLSQAHCKNGHQFPRCSYSLLVCDLSIYDYKLCSLCKNHSSIVPPVWLDNDKSFCLYCC